jgi:flagellar basal body rod protein FlgG
VGGLPARVKDEPEASDKRWEAYGRRGIGFYPQREKKMSSGIYSALSGGIARMKELDVAVNNLANAGNIGFKASRLSFATMFDENLQNRQGEGMNFCRTASCFVDYTQGSIKETQRSLDLAIQGEGFFKVAGEDGFLYTRQGNFKLDSEGNLVTSDGRRQVVGANGPVNLQESDVRIDGRGRITADGAEVGRITLYTAEDQRMFSQKADGLWELSPEAEELPAEGGELVQGSLEQSNVNPVLLTTEIIATKRAYAAYLKAMKAFSDIGEKAQQLGRIG